MGSRVLRSPSFCRDQGRGAIVAAPLGDPNAAIPTPQPVFVRPAIAATPGSAPAPVHDVRLSDGHRGRSGRPSRSHAHPYRCSSDEAPHQADMPNNTALPSIDVDPETFAIKVNGDLIAPNPVDVVPMAQRYMLF